MNIHHDIKVPISWWAAENTQPCVTMTALHGREGSPSLKQRNALQTACFYTQLLASMVCPRWPTRQQG